MRIIKNNISLIVPTPLPFCPTALSFYLCNSRNSTSTSTNHKPNEQMNYTGIIIGLITFLTIGLFHPLVIKAEYYLGKKSWWLFLLAGIITLIASLMVENVYASIILGVVSFSSFWSILEIFEQFKRVKKGWFPMNPKRKHEYE